MIAVGQFNRRCVGCDEPHTGQDLRERNFRAKRRFERGGGDGRGPAQHAIIIVVLFGGAAWPFACWSAEPGGDGASRKARSAIDGMVMMQNRDGKLHAESNQRQPNQSETVSRYRHLTSRARFAQHESSDLVSQSWPSSRNLSSNDSSTHSDRKSVV